MPKSQRLQAKVPVPHGMAEKRVVKVGPQVGLTYLTEEIDNLPSTSSAEIGGFFRDFGTELWQNFVYYLRQFFIRRPTTQLQTNLGFLEYLSNVERVGPSDGSSDNTFVLSLANPLQNVFGRTAAAVLTPVLTFFGLSFRKFSSYAVALLMRFGTVPRRKTALWFVSCLAPRIFVTIACFRTLGAEDSSSDI